MRLFVGSSYFDKRQADRAAFYEIWEQNTLKGVPLDTKIVIVAEAGSVMPTLAHVRPPIDVIRLTGDLGHVTDLEAGRKPYAFCGWTSHMLALAMLAYNDEADFLYKESDCLAFGPWLEAMYRDLGDGDIVFGRAHRGPPGMPSSQSLFLVRHRFITEFVSSYIAFGGDATVYGETKFCKLRDKFGEARVKTMPWGYDRERPVEYSDPVFYMQQIYPEELEELRKRKLI